MLSSTSLLHGNCIFNRNNTVATQHGLKTYWLCKSYRITMCKARCITHFGRVISATGMHNHQPHMKGNNPNEVTTVSTSNVVRPSNQQCLSPTIQQQQQHQQQQHIQQQILHGTNQQLNQSPQQTVPPTILQNMMQNVINQNNSHHLTSPHHVGLSLSHVQHPGHLNFVNPPSSLQITPITHTHNQHHNLQSPVNDVTQISRAGSLTVHQPDTQNLQVNNNMSITSSNSTSSNMSIVVTSSSVISDTTNENCGNLQQQQQQDTAPQLMGSISISPSPNFKIEHM